MKDQILHVRVSAELAERIDQAWRELPGLDPTVFDRTPPGRWTTAAAVRELLTRALDRVERIYTDKDDDAQDW